MTSESPSAMTDSPVLSLVIPVFNEAEGLDQLLLESLSVLKELEPRHEIIVVDDGSSDESWTRILQSSRSNPALHGLRFSRNFGKESAIFAGLEASKGQAIIVMDGDGQHPPAIIPTMLEKWRAGADIVEGVKTVRSDPSFLGRLASRSFNRLFSGLTEVDLTDASDFRLLSRRAVDDLLALPERAFFFRGLSSWIGYSSERVEFAVEPRISGRSKFNRWSLLRYAMSNTIAFTSVPLQLVTLAGLIFCLFAMLLGAQTLWQWYVGQAVEGFTTVILLMLIQGGLVMLALGLIGQYVAQIHQEVKQRPRYLIRERSDSKAE